MGLHFFLLVQVFFVLLQPQTDSRWFVERKRICVIPQAVNLDTSQKYCWDNGDDSLLVVYTYAHTIYSKWSISTYLICNITHKGSPSPTA